MTTVDRATGWRTRLPAGRDVALLTTVGARTGQPRTIPVFYLRDSDRLV